MFGFSRGAAAARNFVSEINKQIGNNKTIFNAKDFNEFEEKLGYDGGQKQQKYQHRFGELGEQLAGNGIKEVKMLSVRFAGLYETVASYGKVHYNDTKNLNLTAIGSASYVFQLVAQDEHRENFAITNIKSAASKGVECYLPGVHSDIGGGYTLNAKEEQLHIGQGNGRNSLIEINNAKKLRTQLINESWYTPKQITIEQDKLFVNRVVASNRYSFIPLHIMVEYANKKGLEFDFIKINKKYPLTEEKSISSTTAKGTDTYCCNLATIKERLDQHVYNGADPMRFTNPADQNMLRLIRTHYIHTSAHYNNKVIAKLYPPHKPHRSYATRLREENDG